MGSAPSTNNKVIQTQPKLQEHQLDLVLQSQSQLEDEQESQLDDVQNENISYWESLYDDSRSLLNYLQNSKNSDGEDEDDMYLTVHDKMDDMIAVKCSKEYIEEYVDLLERFVSLYDDYNGNIPVNRFMTVGDPNKAAFPLPKSVLSNQESLRPWLKKWERFRCGVSTHVDWRMFLYTDMGSHRPLFSPDKLYRPWYNGWSWTFAIDGEAAWDVLPLGVIKRDILTPDQEVLLQQRSKRTDLNDPARMERRRKKLANYFNRKYAEGDTSYCDQHLKFAETLEAGWIQFQELCEKGVDSQIST